MFEDDMKTLVGTNAVTHQLAENMHINCYRTGTPLATIIFHAQFKILVLIAKAFWSLGLEDLMNLLHYELGWASKISSIHSGCHLYQTCGWNALGRQPSWEQCHLGNSSGIPSPGKPNWLCLICM